MKTNNGTFNYKPQFETATDTRVRRAPADVVPAWIREQDGKEKDAKDIIGEYVAKHFIGYGAFLLMGPGTTPIATMKQSIQNQRETGDPQDLEILTTNLEIMELGNRARFEARGLFDGLRITLAGGFVSPSMNCLVGDIAAAGISTKSMHPDTVLFGVHGLSFDADIRLTYHFSDELSTQTAYAVRATCRRVILCDATKIGRKSGYAIDVTVEKLLAEADECIIVTNRPNDPAVTSTFDAQVVAFKNLLSNLHNARRFPNKNLVLRLLNQEAGVDVEFSLAALREQGKIALTSSSLPQSCPDIIRP